jgi:hypothetical protein
VNNLWKYKNYELREFPASAPDLSKICVWFVRHAREVAQGVGVLPPAPSEQFASGESGVTEAAYWPLVSAPDDVHDCGAVCGMLGKGNRSSRRTPASMSL